MSDTDLAIREKCRVEWCDRNAAVLKGELCYRGFCSRCYKADVEDRRAAKAGLATPDRSQKPAVTAPEKRAERLAVKAEPVTDETVGRDDSTKSSPLMQTHPFGWCTAGQHEGAEIPDFGRPLYPGEVQQNCPSVYWSSTEVNWQGCPCDCHHK